MYDLLYLVIVTKIIQFFLRHTRSLTLVSFVEDVSYSVVNMDDVANMARSVDDADNMTSYVDDVDNIARYVDDVTC